MTAQRPYGNTRGNQFGFSKIFVHDLDAMASFYEKVFGLIPFNRHQDVMLGREIDEITYQSTYPGGPVLTLIKYMDSTGPSSGESVQGFVTPDLAALVELAVDAGGSVPEAARTIPGFGIKVAFVCDPEGHINEVVEMISG